MLRALALLAAGAAAQQQAATNLRTEYLVDPVAIAPNTAPRFSWVVSSSTRGDAQSAYWLQVWARAAPARRCGTLARCPLPPLRRWPTAARRCPLTPLFCGM